MAVKLGFELGLEKSKIVPCLEVGSSNEGFVNDQFVWHLPFSGHSNLVLQLYGISSVWVVGFASVLLRFLTMHAMFGTQLLLSLTLNLLQILWSRLFGESVC